MAQTSSRQLGEILLDRKVISRDVLELVLDREEREDIPMSTLLVKEGLVGEKDIIAAVAEQVGLPFIDLAVYPVRPDLEAMLPEEIALAHSAVVIDRQNDTLVVAMENPSDPTAIEVVEGALGQSFTPAIAVRGELLGQIARMYGDVEGAKVGDSDAKNLHLNDLLGRILDLDGSDLHLTVGVPPSVRINGGIKHMTEFGAMTASDIRRMLYDVLTQKQRERFEEELELDTSHTIPGRGRFRMNVFQQRNAMGAVFRAIPSDIVPISALGLPPIVETFAELHRGLVLVTGPTGSGKTTTLYSALSELNQVTENLSTAEDPVEFNLEGINQVQMHDSIGLNFSSVLRSFLRQDPDIILVGEIRDFETAEIAIKAALTGHLVLSTLHTNDAPSTINRLLNMGVEPFMVTASLNLIAAQRLARRLCKECKAPFTYDKEACVDAGMKPEEHDAGGSMKGMGCRICGETGFKGRVALYEIMPMSDVLKEAVLQGYSAQELKRVAVEDGMQTLRRSGLAKIMQGTTSLPEVIRVTRADNQ